MLGGPLLGGLFGDLFGGQKQNQEAQILQQMMQKYDALGVPLMQTLGPSAMQGVQDDPALLQAQDQSLGALKGISDQGGLNLSDRAALQQIMGQIGQQTNARNAGAVAQAAARGQAGSGDILAAQLANNASAEQNASQTGAGLAGMAQQRALQALMQRGQLAGQVRGQDFGEGSARAQAADSIARYNAQLPAQVYAMNLQKLNGENNASQNLAGMYGQQANQQYNMWSGLGQGAGNVGGAYAMNNLYNQNKGGSNSGYSSPPLVNASGSNPNDWNSWPG